MSAYKKLNKQDVYVSSYTARKSWEASGSLLDTYGVKNLRGVSTNIETDSSGSNIYFPHPNDLDDGYYRQLVYQQIKHLYYSNNFSASLVQTGSYYDNFEQSSYTVGHKNLSNEVGVFGIPRKVFGTHLEPGTIELDVMKEDIDNYVYYSSSDDLSSYGAYLDDHNEMDEFAIDYATGDIEYVESIHTVFGSSQTIVCQPGDYIVSESNFVDESTNQYLIPDEVLQQHTTALLDDGEGNLVYSRSLADNCAVSESTLGQAIYTHGQLVITDTNVAPYYSTYLRPVLKWKSNQPIYTYNVHCKIKDSELNHSLNPSAISGSDGLKAPNVTGSAFEPYITTVGLYNDANELLAVAKLGQPIPKSSKTDMTVVVKIDI